MINWPSNVSLEQTRDARQKMIKVRSLAAQLEAVRRPFQASVTMSKPGEETTRKRSITYSTNTGEERE